ncbi:MAG: hypothetical protein KGI73_03710 [Patescibacteria group bacterium]|nr:hypothetical protein [Patescibacteria group bacterium]
MDFQKVIESEKFTKVLIGVGLLFAALIIFEAGVFVGIRKAGTAFGVGENYYYRAIGPGPFGDDPFGEELSNANGAAGKVLSASPSTILVEGRNGERTVVISATTTVRRLNSATTSSAIAPNDFVIVIGQPDTAGAIHAAFIRVVPAPPAQ